MFAGSNSRASAFSFWFHDTQNKNVLAKKLASDKEVLKSVYFFRK